jgi:hypothetical protein
MLPSRKSLCAFRTTNPLTFNGYGRFTRHSCKAHAGERVRRPLLEVTPGYCNAPGPRFSVHDLSTTGKMADRSRACHTCRPSSGSGYGQQPSSDTWLTGRYRGARFLGLRRVRRLGGLEWMRARWHGGERGEREPSGVLAALELRSSRLPKRGRRWRPGQHRNREQPIGPRSWLSSSACEQPGLESPRPQRIQFA